jgi:hypothetical protein
VTLPSEAWAEAWSLCLDAYRDASGELAELDAAVAQAEASALVGHFKSAAERDQAVKFNTADLRASRIRLQGSVWVLKAEMEFVAAMFSSGIPYSASIDPARYHLP